MSLNLEQKQAVVAEVAKHVAGAQAIVMAENRGMPVAAMTQLRAKARASGVYFRVVKNTLLRLAAKGTEVECLSGLLEGPTAIAIAPQDPVAPAKILADFAKTNAKFELKGGALGGKILSAKDIQALADLPGREVLLARLLGTFSAPATNFVGVLAAVPRSLVQVLAAIQEKKAA